MRPLTLIILPIVLAGCAALSKPKALETIPMATKQFLEQPFGHSESFEDFKANLPKGTRTQRLIHRVGAEGQQPDTIFYFKYKKSKILTYRTHHGQSFVVGGNVVNHQIPLANGVYVGIDRASFRQAFSDLPENHGDTVKIVHSETFRAFSFYFDKNNRLARYSFSGESPKGVVSP